MALKVSHEFKFFNRTFFTSDRGRHDAAHNNKERAPQHLKIFQVQ